MNLHDVLDLGITAIMPPRGGPVRHTIIGASSGPDWTNGAIVAGCIGVCGAMVYFAKIEGDKEDARVRAEKAARLGTPAY